MWELVWELGTAPSVLTGLGWSLVINGVWALAWALGDAR